MRPFEERETISVPNDDGTGAARVAGAYVRGVRIYGSGREIAFDAGGGAVVLGANPDGGIWLDDECVSWRHCEFDARAGGRVVLRDLGSKNGTFVDGNRIEAIELRAGMRIAVGRTAMLTVGSLSRGHRSALELLCGEDPALRAAIEVAVRAGRADCAVLIVGETGTGKELFARLIHESSARVAHPFVAVNCGAIPRDLITSELFGHERGAFTGALTERDGVFVQADRGTLFLDEIGELPPAQQPSLLRVLETRRVRRVGGRSSRSVDVGIVAATHCPHERLRSDLYHRLATVVVRLPPLRDRIGDVPVLVRAFLDELAPVHGERDVSPYALQQLCAYPWHGNVRELRQAVRRAVTLSESSVLEFEDFLPPANRFERTARASEPPPQDHGPPARSMDAIMCDAIKQALEREGSIRRAAAVLGISKSTLSDRVRRYGLTSPARHRRRG